MKEQLLAYCTGIAKSKVEALEKELNATREATASESKSTAGDKHETGRAMMHLEQEKLHKQLAEAQAVLADLTRVDPKLPHTKIGLGSLFTTNEAAFFLAASLGKVEFEGNGCFVLSTKAPIATKFIGKEARDNVEMNGKIYDILKVE